MGDVLTCSPLRDGMFTLLRGRFAQGDAEGDHTITEECKPSLMTEHGSLLSQR